MRWLWLGLVAVWVWGCGSQPVKPVVDAVPKAVSVVPEGAQRAPEGWSFYAYEGAVSPDGRWTVSWGYADMDARSDLRVWDNTAGRLKWDLRGGWDPEESISPTGVGFASDGSMMAVADSMNAVHVVEVASGALVASYPVLYIEGDTNVHFSPDGRFVVVQGDFGTVYVIDLKEKGAAAVKSVSLEADMPLAVKIHASGPIFHVLDAGGRLWEVDFEQVQLAPGGLLGPEGLVMGRFGAGDTLLTAQYEDDALVYLIWQMEAMGLPTLMERVVAVHMGRTMVAFVDGEKGVVGLWALAGAKRGAQIKAPDNGWSQDSGACLAFSPDDRWLWACGTGGVVRTRTEGQVSWETVGGEGEVSLVVPLNDGRAWCFGPDGAAELR